MIFRVLILNMLVKLRFLILFLTFFFTLNLVYASTKLTQIKESIEPYCNGESPNNFLTHKSIKNIEIKINNKKKWYTNIFKILVDFNSEETKTENANFFDFNISQKHKKKFKSKVKVNFSKPKISCDFQAEVRVTGDLWWHLDWRNGVPVTSLHVELVNGHINNVRHFKLLLPQSREGGGNEIFVSSILKEVGFLSPTTFMVKSKINGHNIDYIFQEDLKKEFLESSNLVEGPILEGDERFTIDRAKNKKVNPKLSLSRMANSRYSLKNKTKNKISLDAVSRLNQIYLQHHQTKRANRINYSPIDRLHIDTDKFFRDDKNRSKFQSYVSLIYALDSQHSLSVDDIRLYFDPINRVYLPIFYDGKSNILNTEQKLNNESLNKLVSYDAKLGAYSSINLIKNLDDKKIFSKIKDNGVKLSFKRYLKIKNNIIKRLELISNSDPTKIQFLETKEYFSSLSKNDIKNENLKIVFLDYENKNYFICDLSLKNCEENEISLNKFENTVRQLIKQDFSFLTDQNYKNAEFLYVYDNLDYSKINKKKFIEFKEINLENFTIQYTEDVEVELLRDQKTIRINQKNNSGRTIITGNEIDSWSIFLDGKNQEIKSHILLDHNNLTGCLTFIDIKISNINVNTNDTSCEDSVNFIRVSGDINTINVENSKSDGLDIDFSNVSINSLSFKNIYNDCLDLSFGNYEIINLFAEGCGDKGISVGEKSNAKLSSIYIKNANVGLAAKDSSLVNIAESRIVDTPVCFSSYRKKQEFSGAIVKIKSTNCTKDKFQSQVGSSIILGL